MTEEPKKISFGFSKVSKKSSVIQPKKTEPKSDIQYIDCLEEKSIKLASGEEEQKKELPIIPMRNGNSLRESITEVVKSRGRLKEDLGNNSDLSCNLEHDVDKKEPLTLDELATKEILEDLNKCKDEEPVKETLTVPVGEQITHISAEQSTFEDYENMPISDFGLAMLRGMGWDPKKGIGLNEKLVTPLAPSLRPKGMGLGADKIPTVQNVTSNGELLIMKKGAPVKIVSGPHNNLFGKIEGFDELPGRLMVRLASNNTVVSLSELMVQLVSTTEFSKNVNNSQVKSVEIESDEHGMHKHNVKVEKDSTVNYGLIYSKHRRDEKYKETTENGNEEKKKGKYERTDKRNLSSDSEEMDNETYKQKRSKERYRSDSSSERSSSYKTYKVSREEKKYKSKSKDKYYKEDHKRHSKHRSKYSDSESSRSNKKSSSRRKHRSNSSSDSDSDGKRTYNSNSFKKSYSGKYRKQYKN